MSDLFDEMEIYYETLNDRPDIGWFLQGHIVVEFMLRKRLREKNTNKAVELSNSGFYQVLQATYENGIIDIERKEVLEEINRIRNKYSHELNYRPTLKEWIDLWESAQRAFTDMTDGLEQGLAVLNSSLSIETAERFHLNEFFVQICHDLTKK